jgi:glutathione S-transferase
MTARACANGTLPRYRLQEWLTFIGTEIHKSFSPLFNPNMPEEGKKIYRERLANRFGFVNGELAGKDYLMGDHFTVADAYLYTVTRWAKPMALDLSAFPNLQGFLQRVAARPAVQEALQVEKLT